MILRILLAVLAIIFYKQLLNLFIGIIAIPLSLADEFSGVVLIVALIFYFLYRQEREEKEKLVKKAEQLDREAEGYATRLKPFLEKEHKSQNEE